jgi:hypothetical protein
LKKLVLFYQKICFGAAFSNGKNVWVLAKNEVITSKYLFILG